MKIIFYLDILIRESCFIRSVTFFQAKNEAYYWLDGLLLFHWRYKFKEGIMPSSPLLRRFLFLFNKIKNIILVGMQGLPLPTHIFYNVSHTR